MAVKSIARARPMLVVHCLQSSYEVYIGRGRDPISKEIGRLGNIYSHLGESKATYVVPTVEEAVERHETWARAEILRDPAFRELVKSLYNAELQRFKVLGCWCRTQRKPKVPCHGVTLLKLSAELNGVSLDVEDI